MLFRLAPLLIAIPLLIPFAAQAQNSVPATQGPYGYNDVAPQDQQLLNEEYFARLRADWDHKYEFNEAARVHTPYTPREIEAQQRDYLTRHPNDRPELWRFNCRNPLTSACR